MCISLHCVRSEGTVRVEFKHSNQRPIFLDKNIAKLIFFRFVACHGSVVTLCKQACVWLVIYLTAANGRKRKAHSENIHKITMMRHKRSLSVRIICAAFVWAFSRLLVREKYCVDARLLSPASSSCYGRVLSLSALSTLNQSTWFNIANGAVVCLPLDVAFVIGTVRSAGPNCAINNVVFQLTGPDGYTDHYVDTTTPFFLPPTQDANWTWLDGMYTLNVSVYGGLTPPYQPGSGLFISFESRCGRTEPPTSSPSQAPSAVPSNIPTASPSTFPSSLPSNYPSIFPSESPSWNQLYPSNAKSPSLRLPSYPSQSPFWSPYSSNKSTHSSQRPTSDLIDTVPYSEGESSSISPSLAPSACTDENPRIVGFTLIDRESGIDLGALHNGETIDLSSLSSASVDIRVDIRSCRLGSSGGSSMATVFSQYFFDTRSSQNDTILTSQIQWECNPADKPTLIPLQAQGIRTNTESQRVVVSLQAAKNCRGVVYDSAVLEFTVNNTFSCNGQVSSLAVLGLSQNGQQKEAEYHLTNGDTVCLSSSSLIEARTAPFCNVSSIAFELTGALQKTGVVSLDETQLASPTFLFQPLVVGNGTLSAQSSSFWPQGKYTLTATPLRGVDISHGTPLTVDFNVDCGTPSFAPPLKAPTMSPSMTSAPITQNPTSCTSSVTNFTLVDSDLGTDLGQIADGALIDFADLPTNNVHVHIGVHDCGNVQSVYTSYNNGLFTNSTCDSAGSFNLLHDKNSGPNVVLTKSTTKVKQTKGTAKKSHAAAGPVVPVSQSLVAALNTQTQCSGYLVEQSFVTFDLVNSVECGGMVASFVVYDTQTKSRLFQVEDGSTVCIPAGAAVEARTIRASGKECKIRRVLISVNGPLRMRRVAKGRPPYLTHSTKDSIWPNGFYSIHSYPMDKKTNKQSGGKNSIHFTVQC